MTRAELLRRLTPFSVGLAALCVLQAAVDAADPTAGDLERVLSLLLVAFALSGVAGDLLREPAEARPPSPATAWLLRRALLVAAPLLLGLALLGRTLGPLVDGVLVVGVLTLAAATLGLARPVGRLGRAALPLALVTLGATGALAATRLAALT